MSDGPKCAMCRSKRSSLRAMKLRIRDDAGDPLIEPVCEPCALHWLAEANKSDAGKAILKTIYDAIPLRTGKDYRKFSAMEHPLEFQCEDCASPTSVIAAGWSVGFEDEDPDEWDEWSDNKFIPMCFYHCAPDGNDKVLFLSLLPNSANDLRMDKEVDELREEHCSRGLDSGYTNLVYGIF